MRANRCIITTCLSAMLFAGVNAHAQGVTQSLGIRAVVPKYRTVGGTTRPAEFAVRFVVDDDGRAVASVSAFASTAAICNTDAEMSVQSVAGGGRASGVVGLGSGAADAGGVGYVAIVAFGAARVQLFADGRSSIAAPASAVTPEATRGSLRVSVAPLEPHRRLVPGSVYLDTLRVTLRPR